MNIIEEVKKLDLPLGQYAVIGSAIMSVKGIRPSKDIDLIVTPRLFAELKNQGWKRKWFFHGVLKCKAIQLGKAEAFSNMNRGSYRSGSDHVINTAEVIDGIPFMNLSELKKFKIELYKRENILDFPEIA